jgi:hypothetical protein
VIDIIKSLFRIRHLIRIEEEAVFLVRSAEYLDGSLNEAEVPPNGDTYNTLYRYVSALGAALET